MKSINAFAERNYLYVILRGVLTFLLVIYLMMVTFNSKATVPDALELVALSILIVAFMFKNAIKNIQFSVTINPDLNPRASIASSVRKG